MQAIRDIAGARKKATASINRLIADYTFYVGMLLTLERIMDGYVGKLTLILRARIAKLRSSRCLSQTAFSLPTKKK